MLRRLPALFDNFPVILWVLLGAIPWLELFRDTARILGRSHQLRQPYPAYIARVLKSRRVFSVFLTRCAQLLFAHHRARANPSSLAFVIQKRRALLLSNSGADSSRRPYNEARHLMYHF